MTIANRDLQRKIDSVMEQHIFRAFEDVDDVRGDTPPSEVARALKDWDLDDYYREWWDSGYEEWT